MLGFLAGSNVFEQLLSSTIFTSSWLCVKTIPKNICINRTKDVN